MAAFSCRRVLSEAVGWQGNFMGTFPLMLRLRQPPKWVEVARLSHHIVWNRASTGIKSVIVDRLIHGRITWISMMDVIGRRWWWRATAKERLVMMMIHGWAILHHGLIIWMAMHWMGWRWRWTPIASGDSPWRWMHSRPSTALVQSREKRIGI